MEHPYMRSGQFMHIPGLQGGSNVQLLKDGRLAHGMDDPRLQNIHDIGALHCMCASTVSNSGQTNSGCNKEVAC